jgi:hypothetical protein
MDDWNFYNPGGCGSEMISFFLKVSSARSAAIFFSFMAGESAWPE